MELIDSHSHIYGEEYAQDRTEMLERAREAGVGTIMAVGADLESSREACQLAESYEQIYCSVGIHPHQGGQTARDEAIGLVGRAVADVRACAIGEIGLGRICVLRVIASPSIYVPRRSS